MIGDGPGDHVHDQRGVRVGRDFMTVDSAFHDLAPFPDQPASIRRTHAPYLRITKAVCLKKEQDVPMIAGKAAEQRAREERQILLE